jgi:CRISPR-associated protein Cas4
MFDYIALSLLNDFIFCPYSIYLHNVYMGGSEELVHATPQIIGRAAHSAIDNKTYSTRKDDIIGISVFSEELGICGKIDIYKSREKSLIERKYKITTIYQGQIYQL